MAGHSHWAGIKHKKALVDKRRGKLWSKLARAITIAAKLGGGNPDTNVRLRYAIEKAKEANMPNDNIERAIKRGTGESGETANYEEVVYEGYGPGGAAVMVVATTDNRNRTVAEIRKIFEKSGGSLGTTGCVSWLFSQKGMIIVPQEGVSEEKLIEIALESGAEDIKQEANNFIIYTQPADLEQVKHALQKENIKIQVCEVSMIPQSSVRLEGEDARRMLALMESLEDHDDVQNVYSNFDVPEEIMAEAESR